MKKELSNKEISDLLEEINWLVNNSEGVKGLQIGGKVIQWGEVLKLYLPTLTYLRSEKWEKVKPNQKVTNE